MHVYIHTCTHTHIYTPTESLLNELNEATVACNEHEVTRIEREIMHAAGCSTRSQSDRGDSPNRASPLSRSRGSPSRGSPNRSGMRSPSRALSPLMHDKRTASPLLQAIEHQTAGVTHARKHGPGHGGASSPPRQLAPLKPTPVRRKADDLGSLNSFTWPKQAANAL